MTCAVPTALADELKAALDSRGDALARAALVIARLEYPRLDPEPSLAALDALGLRVAERLEDGDAGSRIAAINTVLFEQEAFAGDLDYYDDPRNSCLNAVLDRRSGIPITLSVLYMDVARRAGLELEGINFPGHFLVRCPAPGGKSLVVDPFHAGAILSEADCRRLLASTRGEMGFEAALLSPASPTQVATRILNNLKRLYVGMRSFPQARAAANLLLALNPASADDLRDRGLLAYHQSDFAAALRDLRAYLSLGWQGEPDDATRTEQARIWEHIKTLQGRLASLN